MSKRNHIKIKSNHHKRNSPRDKIDKELIAGTTRQKHHTYKTKVPPVYKLYLNICLPYPYQYVHTTKHTSFSLFPLAHLIHTIYYQYRYKINELHIHIQI